MTPYSHTEAVHFISAIADPLRGSCETQLDDASHVDAGRTWLMRGVHRRAAEGHEASEVGLTTEPAPECRGNDG